MASPLLKLSGKNNKIKTKNEIGLGGLGKL